MNLELAPDEVDLLRTLLTQELEGLRGEIHHTRSSDFKEELRATEHRMISLIQRLGPA